MNIIIYFKFAKWIYGFDFGIIPFLNCNEFILNLLNLYKIIFYIYIYIY